jgi:MFS family permease
MQFNAKWTYILCVVLFELGSAICGAAPSMDALIIGRAICGVAGSGMYVGVITLLAATTTIHKRPMYIGGTGLTWGLGTVLGPVTGGGSSDSPENWRWAFTSIPRHRQREYIAIVSSLGLASVFLHKLLSL